jgi:hypothetical protein
MVIRSKMTKLNLILQKIKKKKVFEILSSRHLKNPGQIARLKITNHDHLVVVLKKMFFLRQSTILACLRQTLVLKPEEIIL